MTEYVLSVVGVVLLCALLTVVIPEGKTSSMIKGTTKVVCLLTIVAPIINFFSSQKTNKSVSGIYQNFFSESVIPTDFEFIKYYSEMRIKNTEYLLEQELLEKYGISVTVAIEWQTEQELVDGLYEHDQIRIVKLYVKTDGVSSEEDKRTVLEYLKQNYCSEVLIE